MSFNRAWLFAKLSLCLALLPWLVHADVRPLPTVASVNLDRYQGRWYEIARLPMWFERNCIGDVTATYAVRQDGHINVVNRCRTEAGFISAQGIAEIPDLAYPGQLRVRFAPEWLAWLPMVWGDYWILDLDSEYRWVMIGSPSRNTLWILARTPTLDQGTTDRLKRKAVSLGFDVTSMVDVSNTRVPE